MKKILVILVALLTIVSCNTKDLYLDELQDGAYVYFETMPDAVVGVSSISDLVYSGTLVAKGPVASYELKVTSTFSNDTAIVGTYTSFPINFSLTSSNLAGLLGVTVDDINFGDGFSFIGTVTATDGTVYYGKEPKFEELTDVNNNDSTSYHPNGNVDVKVFDQANGYKSGFAFNFIIGCPENSFNVESFVGTYQWVTDPWETWVVDGIFEIVAGPGENQITCIDVFDHPVPGDPSATYDMIIDIDPVTGAAIVEKQSTWHPATWGLADWGQGYHQGTGTIFGCADMLMLNLTVFDEAGHNWGVNPYTAVKL